jgi:hypothetical protein
MLYLGGSNKNTSMSEDMSTPIQIAKKPRAKSAKTKVMSTASTTPQSGSVCRSCHLLPVGSMDLTALMLVLVFSLSAVLFTTVYALNLSHAEVAQLKTQLTYQQ